MKDSDFQVLVASVRQAGQIRRGEIVPARRFEVRPQEPAVFDASPLTGERPLR